MRDKERVEWASKKAGYSGYLLLSLG